MNTTTTSFGNLPDGREAQLFSLKNVNGISVKITNYGGIITKIEMPDKNGVKENIVCGFPNLENYLSDAYLENCPYFGAIIGRYCNRISKGQLEIGGRSYALETNNGNNHLHGGINGFDKKLWTAVPFEKKNAAGVKLSYHSPHLEEKYPGNLDVTCIYTLNDNNELEIEFTAKTDQPTVVNLTNHTYFNLTAGRDTILDHELKLAADKMTEMSGQVPTGSIVSTADSPYDFSEFKTFASDLKKLPAGYDDYFVLDNKSGELSYAGTLREKSSGRNIEIYTTQPGLQLYTGYWIPEIISGEEKRFGRFAGVALETQHYPDSVHHPNFPSTLLQPGEIFSQKTVYRFTVNSV